MKLLKEIWFMMTTPMKDQHYCFGCKELIHHNDLNEHEAMGHKVDWKDEEYYMIAEQEMK